MFKSMKKYDEEKLMEPEHAVALYRLGNKYGIEHLREDVLCRMKEEYPSTLPGWREASPSTAFFPRKELLTTMANLAYEYNILSVLPAIYVDLCQYSTEGLFDMKDKDLLNPAVLKACLIGKDKLIHALRAALDVREGAGEYANCLTGTCGTIFSLLSRDIDARYLSDRGIFCHTGTMVDFYDVECCAECLKFLKGIAEPIRAELWDNLPSFFGLPTWAELKAL
ncbi:hypothetical protein CPC08DRAFT_763786 [Agrocybe pediades]|nr:hypothetical protein CPC08DRAFT_763786 [Agrocybe pediades]